MTPITKQLLARVAALPQDEQEELAEYVREIKARRTGVYHATAEQLLAIDDALGQIARGEIATPAVVREPSPPFARHER